MKCPKCGSVKQLAFADTAEHLLVACGVCGWHADGWQIALKPGAELFSYPPEAFQLPTPKLEKPKLGPRAEWHAVMMNIARAAAGRSRDETTRVGATVCDQWWRVLGTGYNGGPANSPESLPAGGPARHLFTVHAEENALLQAVAVSGIVGLQGTRLFSTHRPCARCLRLAAHLGIAYVEFAVDQLSDVQADEADEIERVLYFPPDSHVFGIKLSRDQR